MRGFTVHIDETQRSEPVANASGGPERTGEPAPGIGGVTVVAPLSEPVPSENEHQSGQLVDQYRILKLIAVGGTARVYEAVHEFTNKPVALKIMRNRLAERRDVRERFRQEARLLASIRHENVVAVDNAGLTDDGRVFIAMELLQGQTLRDLLIRRSKVSPTEMLRVLFDVASGVSAAHRAGVTHRDLKPENIFCVDQGTVKVLDLGTAKFAGENAPSLNTAVGRIIGTVAYIAPERFTGDPGDARSDIYALGLIAYECLAGHHPMVPDRNWPSAAELASRQVTYTPRPIADAPPAISNIIAKAIQKAPSLRFQSVSELLAALRVAEQELEHPERSLALATNVRKAQSLKVPILAGALFGVLASGSVQTLRLSHASPASAASAASSGLPAPKVSVTLPLGAAPTISSALVIGSSLVHASTAQPSGESPPGPTERLTRSTGHPSALAHPLRAQREEPATSKERPATAEPVTGTEANVSGRAAARIHEAAPAAKAPKDDLPASGL